MAFGDISRINTNLQSMSAQLSLNNINQQLAKNQMELSTGLRINKAEDDSAGFSIASKLSGKLAGMNQAMQNIGDAKSVLDIAETGTNTIMDTLIQMKSKATQAANDTLGDTERGYIGQQLMALAKSINNVATTTSYQGTNLLSGDPTAADGTGSASMTFQVGDTSTDTKSVSIGSLANNTLFADLKSGTPTITGITINGTGDTPAGTAYGTLTIDTSTATAASYRSFISEIDKAISTVATTTNQLGIDQNDLTIRQNNLSQSIVSNSAAKSRIMDANFAQVKSDSVRLQILQQTATAALTQANASPQSVLSILKG